MLAADDIATFDLSLSATGWARGPVSGVLCPPDSVGKGLRRLSWIRQQVLHVAQGARIAVSEGYAYGREQQAHQLGELGGVVRLALYEAGIFQAIVQPSSLKQYAAGNGNAKKDLMLAEAIRKLGYRGHDHNEADALWLQQMAFDQYQVPGAIQLPAKQRAILEKITWPKP